MTRRSRRPGLVALAWVVGFYALVLGGAWTVDWINGAGKSGFFGLEQERRAEAVCEGKAVTEMKLNEGREAWGSAEGQKLIHDTAMDDCIGQQLGRPVCYLPKHPSEEEMSNCMRLVREH
jgi:hypothetical protein